MDTSITLTGVLSFIGTYVLPYIGIFVVYFYRQLDVKCTTMSVQLETLRGDMSILQTRISAVESEKITYLQCVELLEKSSEKFTHQMDKLEGKIDMLIAREMDSD
jgi:ACT domain-containing protein